MKAETKYIKGVKHILLPYEAFDALVGKIGERLSEVKREKYRKQMVSFVRQKFMIENGVGVIPLTIKQFTNIKNLLETEDTI